MKTATALLLAALAAGSSGKPKVEFKPTRAVTQLAVGRGEARARLEVDFKGEACEIAFNPDYLVEGLKKSGGRNSNGRKTSRHRGGGAKRLYRKIDFKRNRKDGIPAKVAAIEYDPNRTAYIALLHYADGEKAYILAPKGLNVGDHVSSGHGSDIKPGNALPLRYIPVGTTVHNVELRPGGGGAPPQSPRSPGGRPPGRRSPERVDR